MTKTPLGLLLLASLVGCVGTDDGTSLVTTTGTTTTTTNPQTTTTKTTTTQPTSTTTTTQPTSTTTTTTQPTSTTTTTTKTTTTTTTTTSTTSTTSCDDVGTNSGTVTGQYGGSFITIASGKTYYMSSNWWDAFSGQQEPFNGLSFTVNDQTGNNSGSGNPLGFPTIFIGNYGGHGTVNSNLPKLVSSINSVPTSYHSTSLSYDTSNFNSAYDVWFTQSSSGVPSGGSSPGSGGAYLMVWMYKPSNKQPRGSEVNGQTAHTVSGVSGSWQVWYDNSTNPPCVSYVSNTALSGLDYDLNYFIKDAVANGWGVANSQYLALVFGGFEIWAGANGVQLTKFCAQVN